MEYKFDILELEPITGEIIKNGTKNIYNVDKLVSASKWVRQEIKGKKCNLDHPKLSSALSVKQSGYSKLCEGSFGYFYNNGNNVYYNGTNVSMFTSCFSGKSGLPIIPENFIKVSSLFSARKLIEPNWVICKDEYLSPNEGHKKYDQFTNDSIVYSLFNNSSQQSSLRQVTYKGQLWDIKNEFFWLSKEEMMNFANDINYTELYNDARTDNNRYVHNLLFGEQNIYEQLSPEAKLVLDKATELTRMSMTIRSHFADDQNHLNSWDAGYAQLKLVWKEHFSEGFKEFRQLYKNLENRMRPLVYELGFLMK
jgi:hypothetical protein